MRNTDAFEITPHEYFDFLKYAAAHNSALQSAVRGIAKRRKECWHTPGCRGRVTDMGKLRRLLEDLLGREAVIRLFKRREEALADEDFCREVLAKMEALLAETPSLRQARWGYELPGPDDWEESEWEKAWRLKREAAEAESAQEG